MDFASIPVNVTEWLTQMHAGWLHQDVRSRYGIGAGTLLAILLGLLSVFAVTNATGKVYKWVDADGSVHYETHPPPDAKAVPVHIHRSHSANPESGVEVEESTIDYYPVFGNTPYELHMSMLQNGPFNEIVRQRVYAEIHWQYFWNYDFTSEPGKCQLKKFGIALKTRIIMPQWMKSKEAPEELQALWPKVVRKIRKHEDGHKAIAIEGANVLARRLGSLPAFDNCNTLTNVINREGERISNEYALANRAFDRSEALKDSPFDD